MMGELQVEKSPRVRVLDTHQGHQTAACTGSALTKFYQSVGDGATYAPSRFGLCGALNYKHKRSLTKSMNE